MIFRAFCNEPEARFIQLSASPLNGGSRVQVALGRGDSNPCQHFSSELNVLLPDLTAPSGSELLFDGRGASSSSDGSKTKVNANAFAFLRINLDAGEIEEHFRAQLEATGWRLRETASSGSGAWSIWDHKGDGGLELVGQLLVLDMSDSDRTFVLISAEGTGPAKSPRAGPAATPMAIATPVRAPLGD